MLNLLLSYFGGIITGILLSLIAIIMGKKFEIQVNTPLVTGKAEIIKRKDFIDDITNDH